MLQREHVAKEIVMNTNKTMSARLAARAMINRIIEQDEVFFPLPDGEREKYRRLAHPWARKAPRGTRPARGRWIR